MTTQTQIDFSRRGEQLRLLDRIQFERGQGVAPATLCLVLRVVDSFAGESGWCWAAASTMGQRANLCDRTIRNALKVLHEMFLVRKQQRVADNGARQCRYQIVWSNVSAAVDDLESDDGDGWSEVDQTYGNPTENQRKEIPSQRNAVTDPAESDYRPNGISCRVSAIEPQLPPPLPETKPVPIERRSVGREEEAILELLAKHVCRSEAVRLSKLIDLESAQEAIAEYRHPMNSRYIRGPGALVHRLSFGEWPDPLIRSMVEIEAETNAKRAREAQEAAQREIEAERMSEAQRQAEELERCFGADLDAMSDSEVNRLARSVLDDFNYCRWVRGGDYRAELLEGLTSETSNFV